MCGGDVKLVMLTHVYICAARGAICTTLQIQFSLYIHSQARIMYIASGCSECH